MNKKILTLIIILVFFFFFLITSILRYRAQKPSFLETIPLFTRPTPAVISTVVEKSPSITPLSSNTPKQTNIAAITKSLDSDKSLDEKDKVLDALPIRIEDFSTSVNLKTTINIYFLIRDPASAIRLEIYGVNFNNVNVNGPDAIAFKESFLEAKKRLVPYGINLKNLQIIYGNRQYIQDTAENWVKYFNLLN